MKNRGQWDLSTRLNHPEFVPLKEGNRPLLQPIYQSAKFTPSADYPYWDQFIYSRISNPTTRQLELSLADIMGKEDCLVFGSGIAAITNTFLGLLKSGDHLISFRELYKPSRMFIREILPGFKIENTILSLHALEELEKAIVPGKTKLIHFESPSNPNLDIADIEKIVSVARKHKLLVTMDGTFAGLHQHNQYDVDVMIHSLTKYANGHGDVIAGAIAGSRDILKKIREMSVYLGAAMDPQTANLIQRGLKTYGLRYERQCKTAAAIAAFLKSHPRVKVVRYPDSELAKKQMKDMGAVVTFEVDENAGKANVFCHKLNLIQLAASLGSTESIIAPTNIFFGQDLTAEELRSVGINDYTVRLSVGLEHPDDLINDLKEALG